MSKNTNDLSALNVNPDDNPKLATLKTRINGKNADINVYEDHLTWKLEKGMTVSFRERGKEQVLFYRAVTGLDVHKSGLTSYTLKVITAGNSIEVRASKDEIDTLKNFIQSKLA